MTYPRFRPLLPRFDSPTHVEKDFNHSAPLNSEMGDPARQKSACISTGYEGGFSKLGSQDSARKRKSLTWIHRMRFIQAVIPARHNASAILFNPSCRPVLLWSCRQTRHELGPQASTYARSKSTNLMLLQMRAPKKHKKIIHPLLFFFLT